MTERPNWSAVRVPRRAAALLLACAVALATAGVRCSARQIWIEGPGGELLVAAPEVVLRVELSPPLEPAEQLLVTTSALADTLGEEAPPAAVVAIDADRAGAQVALEGLAPGRTIAWVERIADGADLGSLAGVIVDRGGYFPDSSGPYAVGAFETTLERTSLQGTLRTLELVVWYPVDPELDLPVSQRLAAIEAAPALPGARMLPTMLFSHGSCGVPLQSRFLTADLARMGFVVLAMSHPGNTAFDPNCGSAQNQGASFFERPNDAFASLNWLLAESADDTSPLFDLVDSNRIGIMGHSFGGLTSLLVPPVDARIRASMPMAPAYSQVAGFVDPTLPFDIPVMIQGAELDTTTPFETNQRAVYDKLAAPRFLVNILGAGHLAFSDVCSTPQLPPCAPNAPDPSALFDIVRQYARGFLGAYVAGDRRWLELIRGRNGVVLEQDR